MKLTKPTAAGLAMALLTAAAAFSLPDDSASPPSADLRRGSATRASAPLATGHLPTGQVAGDCNSDGIVDSRDLSVLLSGYGDAGFDPVAGGECPSWREWDDRERQFRESIADIPTAQGAPYPPMSGPIIRGDWDQSDRIDGNDLSVLLANFGRPSQSTDAAPSAAPRSRPKTFSPRRTRRRAEEGRPAEDTRFSSPRLSTSPCVAERCWSLPDVAEHLESSGNIGQGAATGVFPLISRADRSDDQCNIRQPREIFLCDECRDVRRVR